MNEYRYPGLQPFETKDAALFYGREREARDLYAQVTVEKMVVLFSKSGMGKSSLLNAGLTPLLEKTSLLPLRIRLSNEAVALEEQFLQELEKAEWKANVTLPPALRKTGAPLWEQIKAATFTKNGAPAIPFFVLDQFEEVFTLYSPARRERFLKELADLTNGNPPEAYLTQLRARIGAGERLDVPALESSPRCKFIFSIRSDLLHLLNGISPLIPDIMRSRFELLPLDQEQAEEAVTLPAMLRDPERSFVSQPFRYDDAALASILEYLTKDGAEAVESFQLQILCRAIELRAIEKNARSVTPALFGGIAGLGHIIRDFYMAKIGELAADAQLPARQLLEEQLITDNGRRRSVAEDELTASRALLDQLVEMRLLRKEPRLGTFYYEISHDTLVGPILEKYKERRMEEESRAEVARLEAERLENQRQAAEAEARIALQKADADRRRRRALITALIAGALVLVAVVTTVLAIQKSSAAEIAEEKARNAEEKAGIAIAEADRQTEAAIESDSKAKLETEKAESATNRALEAQKDADEKTKIATAAQADALRAEKKATDATKQSGIDSENARAAKAEAVLKKDEADAATKIADAATQKAKILTVQVASNLLEQSRGDMLRLKYDAAFAKLKNAETLGAIKDSVAFGLMEIAFFQHYSGNTDTMTEALSLAAGLLGKDLSSIGSMKTTSGFEAALRMLDKKTDSVLNSRYFPTMLPIRGGTDTLGGIIDRNDDSIPPYIVTISSFKMAKTETTWWQYNLFCAATKHEKPEKPGWGAEGDNPVINVSWYDAVDYANWLSDHFGLKTAISEDSLNLRATGYRLPTEAEWEYAARAGKNYNYAGSDLVDLVGWYGDNSGSRTRTVATKNANAFGLFDMSGNVWEWCWDWDASYDNKQRINPIGPDKGGSRVNRGGGWLHDARDCRAAYRDYDSPEFRLSIIGFRLCLSSQ